MNFTQQTDMQKRLVEVWNQAHPVGTPVRFKTKSGDGYKTRTTGRAGLISGIARVTVDGLLTPVRVEELEVV